MLLRELFDAGTSLPLEWEDSDTFTVARAYDRQGRVIEVNFNNDTQGTIDVEFSRGGSMDTTGKGDEQIVFTTVITAIRQYMNTHQDTQTVYFNGAADRQKLYAMLAARLGQEYGFHRAARPAGSVFKMVRNR
jgi:hypothetical protein